MKPFNASRPSFPGRRNFPIARTDSKEESSGRGKMKMKFVIRPPSGWRVFGQGSINSRGRESFRRIRHSLINKASNCNRLDERVARVWPKLTRWSRQRSWKKIFWRVSIWTNWSSEQLPYPSNKSIIQRLFCLKLQPLLSSKRMARLLTSFTVTSVNPNGWKLAVPACLAFWLQFEKLWLSKFIEIRGRKTVSSGSGN